MTNLQKRRIKTDLTAVAIIAIVLSFIIGMFMLVGYIETHYTVKAKIVEIDGNTYTVETKNGHQFKFELPEYEVGDSVELNMVTNNTDNFYDDEIEVVEIEDHNKITLK